MLAEVVINRRRERNKVELPPNFTNIYSIGHICKDLCQSIWYSYMTLFLTNVIGMPAFDAALLMTIGQIANIIGTKLSMDTESGKTGHSIGFVLVAMTFVLIFFPYAEYGNDWNRPAKRLESLIFHASLIIVFQIGIAFMQLTHILAVPYTVKNQERRQEIVAHRFLLQSVTRVFAYVVVWIVLISSNIKREMPSLIPADCLAFSYIAAILTGVAFISFCLFYGKTKTYSEQEQMALELIPRKASKPRGRPIKIDKNTYDFLRAFVYCFLKVHYLCILMYLPLWIDEREQTSYKMALREAQIHGIQVQYDPFDIPGSGGISAVALVPMTMSLFSAFTAAFLLKYRLSTISYMNIGLLGMILCLFSGFYVFLIHPTMTSLHLYVVAIMLGVGNAAAQITSGFKVTKIIHGFRGQKTHAMVCFLDKIVIITPILLAGYLKCPVHEECHYFYHETFNPMLFSIPVLSLCGSIILNIAYLCSDE